ncbi:unnamed protein product [Closterium sp. NIES-64]|nr:unnamed protein product [Closterium sp. NIES-64]
MAFLPSGYPALGLDPSATHAISTSWWNLDRSLNALIEGINGRISSRAYSTTEGDGNSKNDDTIGGFAWNAHGRRRRVVKFWRNGERRKDLAELCRRGMGQVTLDYVSGCLKETAVPRFQRAIKEAASIGEGGGRGGNGAGRGTKKGGKQHRQKEAARKLLLALNELCAVKHAFTLVLADVAADVARCHAKYGVEDTWGHPWAQVGGAEEEEEEEEEEGEVGQEEGKEVGEAEGEEEENEKEESGEDRGAGEEEEWGGEEGGAVEELRESMQAMLVNATPPQLYDISTRYASTFFPARTHAHACMAGLLQEFLSSRFKDVSECMRPFYSEDDDEEEEDGEEEDEEDDEEEVEEGEGEEEEAEDLEESAEKLHSTPVVTSATPVVATATAGGERYHQHPVSGAEQETLAAVLDGLLGTAGEGEEGWGGEDAAYGDGGGSGEGENADSPVCWAGRLEGRMGRAWVWRVQQVMRALGFSGLSFLSHAVLSAVLLARLKAHVHASAGAVFDRRILLRLHRWLQVTALPFVTITTCTVTTKASTTGISTSRGDASAISSCSSRVSDPISAAHLRQWHAWLRHVAGRELCAVRTGQLFDIIVDYPDSTPALLDLKDCLENGGGSSLRGAMGGEGAGLGREGGSGGGGIGGVGNAYGRLVASFRAALANRLLTAGASTADILQQYVSAIRALRLVDPSGVVLEAVSEPIRQYLRGRKDTIRCIMTLLTQHPSAAPGGAIKAAADVADDVAGEAGDPGDLSLLEELSRAAEGGEGEMGGSGEGEEEGAGLGEDLSAAYAAAERWQPDPIDADPWQSSGQAQRARDIVRVLAGVFGLAARPDRCRPLAVVRAGTEDEGHSARAGGVPIDADPWQSTGQAQRARDIVRVLAGVWQPDPIDADPSDLMPTAALLHEHSLMPTAALLHEHSLMPTAALLHEHSLMPTAALLHEHSLMPTAALLHEHSLMPTAALLHEHSLMPTAALLHEHSLMPTAALLHEHSLMPTAALLHEHSLMPTAALLHEHSLMPTAALLHEHSLMPTAALLHEHSLMPTAALLHEHSLMPTAALLHEHSLMPTAALLHEHNPIDADPWQSSGQAQRARDIVRVLAGVFGSREVLLGEYRGMLAERLVGHAGYDTDRDVRTLELLKLRFGESNLHACEVMLRDMADSKRINGNVKAAMRKAREEARDLAEARSNIARSKAIMRRRGLSVVGTGRGAATAQRESRGTGGGVSGAGVSGSGVSGSGSSAWSQAHTPEHLVVRGMASFSTPPDRPGRGGEGGEGGGGGGIVGGGGASQWFTPDSFASPPPPAAAAQAPPGAPAPPPRAARPNLLSRWARLRPDLRSPTFSGDRSADRGQPGNSARTPGQSGGGSSAMGGNRSAGRGGQGGLWDVMDALGGEGSGDEEDEGEIEGGEEEEEAKPEEKEELLEAENLDATIVSALFWPAFQEESVRLPAPVTKLMEEYSTNYATLKAPRKLQWKANLGCVTIELEFGNGRSTQQYTVTPVQAAIILKFQTAGAGGGDKCGGSADDGAENGEVNKEDETRPQWAASELAAAVGLSVPVLRRRITFWVNQGVIVESVATNRSPPEPLFTAVDYQVDPASAGAAGDAGGDRDGDADAAAAAAAGEGAGLGGLRGDGEGEDMVAGGELLIGDEDEEEEGGGMVASLEAQRKQESAVHESFITGMLTTFDGLPIERIHNMLKMFVSDPPYDRSLAQLHAFLGVLVAQEKLELRDGLYRKKK